VQELQDKKYSFLLQNIRTIVPFAVKDQQRFFKVNCKPIAFDIKN